MGEVYFNAWSLSKLKVLRWPVAHTQKEMKMRPVPVLLSLLAMAVAARGFAEITVAERGQPSAYTLVIPAKAFPNERYAAQEFRDWTLKLTGVEIPIRETTPVAAKAIYLNREKPDPALGDEGFDLEAVGGDIRVSGGRRGLLYGVYELLERFGGIAWLDSGFTDIPQTDVFKIPSDLKDRQLPAFDRRVHDWRQISSDISFSARSRINHYYLPERHGRSYPKFDGPLGCHTFSYLVNPDQYFDEHPNTSALQRQAPETLFSSASPIPMSSRSSLKSACANPHNKTKGNNVKYYGISQND